MEVAALAVSSLIEADRATIDSWLEETLRPVPGNPVADAMRYAVVDGGQRLRPLLSLRVARMLDAEHPAVISAAAAVELVHCASLIVDDLPCMDNSETRRGRPCTHLLFSEPVALLAAFSLVALAGKLPLERHGHSAAVVRFQRKLLSTMDCSSLMAGQILDLAAAGANRGTAEISDLKTVPLFRIAMDAGAVMAQLSTEQRCALDNFGREFGLAYQLVDDYLDGDLQELSPVRIGLARARAALFPFGRRARELEEMLDYLNGKTFEANHHSR